LGVRVMRVISKLLAVASLLFSCSAANAETVYFDISNQAGFTRNGIGGIFGNGSVSLSPVYRVGYGATVDFGTAFIVPDAIDGRTNCQFSNNCGSNYGYNISFLTGSSPGLATAPFDMYLIPGSVISIVSCPNLACPSVALRLLFTLPEEANGIQFAFQAGVSIQPPSRIEAVPEPTTWAMLLIGFAGIGFATYRRGQRTLRTARSLQ
jgi:hypothetical protein